MVEQVVYTHHPKGRARLAHGWGFDSLRGSHLWSIDLLADDAAFVKLTGRFDSGIDLHFNATVAQEEVAPHL